MLENMGVFRHFVLHLWAWKRDLLEKGSFQKGHFLEDLENL